VVKERRILREVKHLKDQLWVTFWLMAIGPTQNQEVTTLKIVTFFLVPGFGGKMGCFILDSSFQFTGSFKFNIIKSPV